METEAWSREGISIVTRQVACNWFLRTKWSIGIRVNKRWPFNNQGLFRALPEMERFFLFSWFYFLQFIPVFCFPQLSNFCFSMFPFCPIFTLPYFPVFSIFSIFFYFYTSFLPFPSFFFFHLVKWKLLPKPQMAWCAKNMDGQVYPRSRSISTRWDLDSRCSWLSSIASPSATRVESSSAFYMWARAGVGVGADPLW